MITGLMDRPQSCPMRRFKLFNIAATIALIIFWVSNASASGLLGDIMNQLAPGVGTQLDQMHQQMGKPIDATVFPPEKTGKAKAVIHGLSEKSSSDVLLLTMLPDPCNELDCRGLSSDDVRPIISATSAQKQAELDLKLKTAQAYAAIISLGISILSLIVSALSFWRAGRQPTAAPSPQRRRSA